MISPSPMIIASAPCSKYLSLWSVASEPEIRTVQPCSLAAEAMMNAAARMRVRHILER